MIIDPYGYHTLGGYGSSLARLTSEDTTLDDELRSHFESPEAKARPSVERIQRNAAFMSMKPHWLLLLHPFIAGFSLKSYQFSKYPGSSNGEDLAKHDSHIPCRQNPRGKVE